MEKKHIIRTLENTPVDIGDTLYQVIDCETPYIREITVTGFRCEPDGVAMMCRAENSGRDVRLDVERWSADVFESKADAERSLAGFAELPEFAAQREKILDIVPEIENVDYENDLTCISFYAAECAEFPVMGEVHYDLTLPEALEAYEKIPSERMHGLKCVGFDLKDGSDYEGMQSLMIEGKIQKEFLNSIPGFRENSYVQNAISRVEKYLEERHPNVENPLESNKKVDNEKNISEEKNEKELNIQMKPIPKKKRGEMSL